MISSLIGVSCASTGGSGGAATGGGSGLSPETIGKVNVVDTGPTEVASGRMGPLTATKFRLPNGLEVILMPDEAALSVAYMTWYRVGSRNENEAAGETGLAHLFEHLMFTQTKGAKEPGEFDALMESAGAQTNAMTYYDFTAYIDNVPPGELELCARLESNRMLNLELRQGQVENERDVVAEERLSSVEDSVDGILEETIWAQAFKTHPYRWPVIGRMKDIKAVTDQKAYAFYSAHYAPNNAVVVVTGRFDGKKVLDLVTRHYGALPAQRRLPTDAAKPERGPDKEVRKTLPRPVPADRLAIGYPGAALGGADRAAYEVVNELLLGGPSSRLFKTLVVDKEIASSAHGDLAPTRDPGLFTVWVQMKKGHVAAEAEAIIGAELDRLVKTPVPDTELGKAKNRLETAFWSGLSSSAGRADALGMYDVSAGDFRRLFKRADEIAAVTAADVQRVAAAAFSGGRSVAIASPKTDGPRP